MCEWGGDEVHPLDLCTATGEQRVHKHRRWNIKQRVLSSKGIYLSLHGWQPFFLSLCLNINVFFHTFFFFLFEASDSLLQPNVTITNNTPFARCWVDLPQRSFAPEHYRTDLTDRNYSNTVIRCSLPSPTQLSLSPKHIFFPPQDDRRNMILLPWMFMIHPLYVVSDDTLDQSPPSLLPPSTKPWDLNITDYVHVCRLGKQTQWERSE